MGKYQKYTLGYLDIKIVKQEQGMSRTFRVAMIIFIVLMALLAMAMVNSWFKPVAIDDHMPAIMTAKYGYYTR